MEDTYERVIAMVEEEILKGSIPLEVAAVLIAVSLRMYRTMLSEEDFNLMVDAISDGRGFIESLAPGNTTLQ